MGAFPKLKPVSDAESAFLGVTASARGLSWRDRLDPPTAKMAIAISQRYGLPELLGRVLAARGTGLDDVAVALDPTVKALMPDPNVLQDMHKAAARLADAIQRGEPIAVFGDYDVDGACASALIKRFLQAHGSDARIYIPDRLMEGYGPNSAALKALVVEGARLIITVDCGTTSVDTLEKASALGADIIVVDHHQADEHLPSVTALVNPNRLDDISGLGHLCAAGVAFMLLVATTRELRHRGHYAGGVTAPDLLMQLDLVALATVCDVVPLKGLNRALVTKGLQVIHQRLNLGLKALGDAAGLVVPATTYHLGFVLGPRINAGGRIGEAALGARLLSTSDDVEAARIAVLLDKLNRERKDIEKLMLDEAMALADQLVEANPELPLLMVASEEFHKGIVGLVASRLVERFRRPACVIAWDRGNEGTGSLRSIAGVDIGAVVRAAVAAGHLRKGGGHAMAAGLTLVRDRFAALHEFFNERLSGKTCAARAAIALDIDGALTPTSVTDEFMELIERAGPYGQGSPEPRFAFPAHRVRFAKVVGTGHVRCTIEGGDGSRVEAVAFRSSDQPLGAVLLGSAGMPVHVAGHLRRNTWNGRTRCELVIEDAADPRRQT